MIRAPLRIGVNLLWLRPGLVGGSEHYIVNLLRAIAARRPVEVDIRLYAHRSFATAHPDLVESFATTVAPPGTTSRPVRVLLENTWLGRRLARDGVDVVHHAGGTMPRRSGPHPVLVLHDLQYLDHPEHFALVKRVWLGFVVPRSARRAIAIVAGSAHTRHRIVTATGVAPERVVVVHHAIAPPRAPVRVPVGIGVSPYVYYPAWTHPHKNHVTLLEAVRRVEGLHLVLTGGAGAADDEVADTIVRLGIEDRVHRLGHVTADRVESLYAGADALVFPSTYEGFGAPVAEAMVRGVPVVSSSATALAEVVADGGVLVEATDVDEWVAALRHLREPGVREELSRRGRARAVAFDPEVAVDAHLALWQRVSRT